MSSRHLTHFPAPCREEASQSRVWGRTSASCGHFLFPNLCVTLFNLSPATPLQPRVLAPTPTENVNPTTTTASTSIPQKASLPVFWKIQTTGFAQTHIEGLLCPTFANTGLEKMKGKKEEI